MVVITHLKLATKFVCLRVSYSGVVLIATMTLYCICESLSLKTVPREEGHYIAKLHDVDNVNGLFVVSLKMKTLKILWGARNLGRHAT